MKNKVMKSITYKIFVITSILLVVTSLSIYFILYFLMPSYYYKYKQTNLQKGLDKLVASVEKLTIDEATGQLDDFTAKYNVGMRVIDRYGRLVYAPMNFIRIVDGRVLQEVQAPISIEAPLRIPLGPITQSGETPSVYTTSREVKFLNDSNSYLIYVNATMQPIDEASRVLIMFLPYIGLIVLVVAVIGAAVYSKLIAQPLLRINRTAKHMADLNFDKLCEVKGEDEIGELSKSLNNLSSNLQVTMLELKNANEKLMDDIARERELEKKRREFISTISHELKTPITIMRGQLEGMIGNIGVYKDHDKYLNRSLKVLQDMEGMVRETLEISKMEAQGFQPVKESFDITSLINEIISTIGPLAQKKEMEIIPVIEEETWIFADERLIKKAVANIIGNAVFHSGKGEKVYVELKSTDDEIVLSVENTGAHIEEKELTEIFKPFYRIEKSRNRSTGGSGLGLYIVKMILDAHKADYHICNTERGVKFTVVFLRPSN